jgi:hypothetical protein
MLDLLAREFAAEIALVGGGGGRPGGGGGKPGGGGGRLGGGGGRS